MSHAATNWAIQQRRLKPIAKILLWHLSDCHNPIAGCFPTQEYLAGEAEISRASVNRYLLELEELGLIRREQSIDPSSKRQRPTRYFWAFEAGFDPQDIVSRVSDSDTASVSQNDDSRVSKTGKAVSHSSETLTCKGTKKETSPTFKGKEDDSAATLVLDRHASSEAALFDACAELVPVPEYLQRFKFPVSVVREASAVLLARQSAASLPQARAMTAA